jgi:hypothetical protein
MVLVLVLIMDLLLLCRYKHPKTECYTKSEKLVEIVNTGLKRHFLPIFQHLYQIRKDEGVAINEGCMGNSPFIGISITKDYHCSVHNDSNDFSYNFFIWLGDGKFLYSTLLYSTLLYSTLLYSTLLYSTLLYSTLLYSTLLYLCVIHICSIFQVLYIYIQFYVVLTYCMCYNRYYGGWKRSSFPST